LKTIRINAITIPAAEAARLSRRGGSKWEPGAPRKVEDGMTEAKRRIQDTEQQESAQTSKHAPKESLNTGRTRRAFLAHLRHELRTLINAIIGYSEMLMEDARDLGQEDFISDLENIHSAGSQLLELVNDTLNLAKIEAAPTERDLEALGAKLCYGLRTSLNDIIGFSEMLLEDAEGLGKGDFIGDLRKIHSAAERFLVFINDSVNLSRIDAKDVELDLDAFDASSMVRDLMASLRPLAEDDATVVAADRGSLLVVDDNEMNRDLLSRHLERWWRKTDVRRWRLSKHAPSTWFSSTS
jgi:signal transduction histidine kinase